MELQNLEEVDRMKPFREIPSELASEQEDWFETEVDSCQICQNYVHTRQLKNLYQARYHKLLDESEQTIKTLKTSFDEAKHYFRAIVEDPLDQRSRIQSREQCITNQLANQCSENANLHLEIRKLNKLLESMQDEQEKERSQWRRRLQEREKTIATLNDNIYYFMRKLKFKRKAHNIIKRLKFKRSFKSILSSNICNMRLRLLAGKLKSPDSNNVNYHFYYKNKFEQESNTDEESCSMGPSRSSEGTLVPLTLNTLKNQETCLHQVILQGHDCSEYADSSSIQLRPDSSLQASDNEVSCQCDNSEPNAPNEISSTEFWSNQSLWGPPSQRQVRTKHSMVFRPSNVMKEELQRNGDCLSNGDGGDFSRGQKCGGNNCLTSDIKDEASICDCSQSEIHPSEESDGECSSARTSVSEEFLDNSPSELSIPGYSNLQHTYLCRRTYSNSTLTEESCHKSEKRDNVSALEVPNRSYSSHLSAQDSFELFDFNNIPKILADSFQNKEDGQQQAIEATWSDEMFLKIIKDSQCVSTHSRPAKPNSRVSACLSTVHELSNESDISRCNSPKKDNFRKVYQPIPIRPKVCRMRQILREMSGEETDTEDDESDELKSILGSKANQKTSSEFTISGIYNFLKYDYPLRTESAPAKLESISPDYFL